MELAEKIQRDYPGLGVMVVTAHGTIATAVEALQSGIYDYITKPLPADFHEIYAKCERYFQMCSLRRQQEKLQKELRDSEEQFRDLYENAPIAYLSIDADGRVQRANQRAVELFGYALEDLIGLQVLDLYADASAGKEKARALFARFRAGEEIHGEELEVRRGDDRTAWISLTVQALRDGRGEVVSSRSMALDITARKRAEQSLADEVQSKYNYEEITGASTRLQEVLKQVELVAPTDASALILGETGTGKELICRAIHHLSRRSAAPLVKLNCAAIPSGLIESELFGHEKGAFTGAVAQKQGRFELAHGGTIFLDEIGDIPLETQPKLLRLLQEQEFERVGGTRTIKVDVRVIAATHRNLEEMVQKGQFREDLFYRLNVFPLSLPPLRERLEDVPILAQLFVHRVCSRWGRPPCAISEAALQHLLAYSWPGNVRELENLIERAVILCGGQNIDREHVQVGSAAAPATTPGPIRTLQEVERDHILAALQESGGRVSGKGGAAELLDLKPTTLEARMKKLGIERDRS
jgi:formate hydrogenlyase transcriptional activator